MRPGQNKRMRGRNNNNRKGPNPLTRSYESNGPDVKIRGTAHHVAEKYLQLARDAQSSGDPVMAESYLQHAEHYFRLISAAQQAQQQISQIQRPGNESDAEEVDEDDDFSAFPDRFASNSERFQSPAPQPPYPVAQTPHSGQQPYQERQAYAERHVQERSEQRPPRGDRSYSSQNRERPQREQRNSEQPRADFRSEPRQQPEAIETPSLPSFITTPTRIASVEPLVVDAVPFSTVPSNQRDLSDDSGAAGYHLRPRRRRRPRSEVGTSEPEMNQGDIPVSE